MNTEENWDNLLAICKAKHPNISIRNKKSKMLNKNQQEDYIKYLTKNADVEDDDVWNYIIYLKDRNDFISLDEYISAVNSQAVACSLTIYCF